MKTCNKCKEIKDDVEFRIRNGKPEGICKECNSKKSKAKYQRNREGILARLKEKRLTDEEFRLKCNENSKKHGELFRNRNPKYASEYFQKMKGTEQYDKYLARTKLKNSQIKVTPELREYRRLYSIKYRSSEVGKFRITLRNNLATALNSRLIENLGFKHYNIDVHKTFNHIGMKPSSDHVLDHIIPLAMFDLSIQHHIELAYSPENLRWITKAENLEKGSKIIYNEILKSPKLLEIASLLKINETHDGIDAKNVILMKSKDSH